RRDGDGEARPVYLAGALLLGIGFLAYVDGFSLRRSTERARGVLRASLIELPAPLTLWLLDSIPQEYNLPRSRSRRERKERTAGFSWPKACRSSPRPPRRPSRSAACPSWSWPSPGSFSLRSKGSSSIPSFASGAGPRPTSPFPPSEPERVG